jgi:heme-based aerotactic transducer
MRQLRLDDREIAGRLAVLGFVQDDSELLVSLRPWAQRVADEFLRLFYDEQFSHDEFVAIVARANSNRLRLQDYQRRYLLSLFDGMPDWPYVESRLRIGSVHAQLGVTPRWYVSSYRLYEKYLFPMLRRHLRFRPFRSRRAAAALSKLLNFDKALVLDMYIEGVTEDLRATSIGMPSSGANQATHLLERMRLIVPAPGRRN